jgi:hypothetical protein
MNESNGKFICPKCNNNNGIASTNGEYSKGNYKKWIYKSENNNGILEKKWFFYNKEEYWYCCSLCESPEDTCSDYLTCNYCDCKDCKDECKDCCCSRECPGLTFAYILGIFLILLYPIVYLFYFLIFLWIDIYNYRNKSHVRYSFGKKERSKVKRNNIWGSAKFESELESVSPWICLWCKHNSPSFKDFIFQSNVLNRTTELQDLKTDDFYLNGIISVLFNSTDGRINYATTCKKAEIFSNVEKKLIDKFPEYKNKKLFYIQSGKVIDKEKSLEENKIIPGFAIIVNTEDV